MTHIIVHVCPKVVGGWVLASAPASAAPAARWRWAAACVAVYALQSYWAVPCLFCAPWLSSLADSHTCRLAATTHILRIPDTGVNVGVVLPVGVIFF